MNQNTADLLSNIKHMLELKAMLKGYTVENPEVNAVSEIVEEFLDGEIVSSLMDVLEEERLGGI